MDGWMDGWTDNQRDRQTQRDRGMYDEGTPPFPQKENKGIDGRRDGWTEGGMDRRRDGQTEGWTDGWTDIRMYGWRDIISRSYKQQHPSHVGGQGQ